MDSNSDNSKSINKMADKIVNTDNFQWNDENVFELAKRLWPAKDFEAALKEKIK